MAADTTPPVRPTTGPQPADHGPGLPRTVLEARARLGPDATPEQVADDLASRGFAGVTVEEVRQLWDGGHLPVG